MFGEQVIINSDEIIIPELTPRKIFSGYTFLVDVWFIRLKLRYTGYGIKYVFNLN